MKDYIGANIHGGQDQNEWHISGPIQSRVAWGYRHIRGSM